MISHSLAAVIMAAGQGKRMKNPDKAKVMNTLGGIPLVHHVVTLARTMGCERIIAIVGHQRQNVISYLRKATPEVEIAIQDVQLGTAHAVQQAVPILHDFSGDIVILSGDAPLTRPETMMAALTKHREIQAAVTVLTAVLPDPSGYGRVLRDNDGRILRIVEHKDATENELRVREINSGIYLFRKEPLFAALNNITNDNAQGEYYLPDVFALFAQQGLPMLPFQVESFDELRGVNTVEQLQEMERLYASLSHTARA